MEDHPQGPRKPGSGHPQQPGHPQGHDPLTLPAHQQDDDPWEDWDEELQAALMLSAEEAATAQARPQAAQAQPQGPQQIHPQAAALETYRPRPPRQRAPSPPWRARCAMDHVEPGDHLIQALPHGGHILPGGGGPILDDRQATAYFTWTQHLPPEHGLFTALRELAELMRSRNLAWIAIDDAAHDLAELQQDFSDAQAAKEAAQGVSEPAMGRLARDVYEAHKRVAAAEAIVAELKDAWEPMQALVEHAQTLVIRMINGDLAAGSIFDDANPAHRLQPDPGLASWRMRIQVRTINYASVVGTQVEDRVTELVTHHSRKPLLVTRIALLILVPIELKVLSTYVLAGNMPGYGHLEELFPAVVIFCLLGLMFDAMFAVDRYRSGPDNTPSG